MQAPKVPICAVATRSLLAICGLMGALSTAVLADSAVHECIIIEASDRSFQYNSNFSECSHPTSPASTFKIPHALIALESDVITDPAAKVAWDGTDYPNQLWEQDHSLDSAIKWSALWFFQRSATLLGDLRMHEGLQRLAYARDSFDRDLTEFWRNGDLVVTPEEQVSFLHQLVDRTLPVSQRHMESVSNAMLMPPRKITLASGEHPFLLDIPSLSAVYAKTGNTTVNGENVSWLTGYIVVADKTYVFASRVRSGERLALTAGAALAQSALNEKLP